MQYSLKLPLTVTLSLLLFSLTGCGEKTVVGQGSSKIEQSQACIDCHQSVINPLTGKVIVEEWKLSRHNTSNAAGCADCHEPETGHPTGCNLCHGGSPSGSIKHVSSNPDQDGKCYKCHSASSGLFPKPGSREAHFNNNTSANYPASYVSARYEKNCRKCHNPHDTTTAMSRARDWAESGHGNTTGATKSNDFKTMGSYKTADQEFSDSISPSSSFPNSANRSVCVRCHTSSGFIKYVKNFSDITPFAGNPSQVKQYNAVASDLFKIKETGTVPGSSSFGKASDRLANTVSKLSPDFTRETINCNVCHDDGTENAYSFSLRKVAPVVTYYNYSGSPGSKISQGIRNNKAQFPDAGTSNICVVCHSGRENGEVIKMASVRGIDFSSVSRVGVHDRAAASNMFRKSGFEFYSSEVMYSSTSYMHDIIGMNTTRTNTSTTPLTFSGKDADPRLLGPCIGCHMNSNATHTFLPLQGTDTSWVNDVSQPFPVTNRITNIASKTCVNCHDDAKTPKLESSWTADSLQIERDRYRATLSAYWYILQYTLATNSLPSNITKIIGPANATISPTSLTHWYNSTGTKAIVAPWLQNNNLNTDIRMSFNDPILGIKSLKNGAFNMGAVFNYTALANDPGAYVHNRRYIKKLIYDSIDWLDDGIMNQSVYYTFAAGTPKDFTTKLVSNPAYTLNLQLMLGATDYDLAGRYLGFINRTTNLWKEAGRLSN